MGESGATFFAIVIGAVFFGSLWALLGGKSVDLAFGLQFGGLLTGGLFIALALLAIRSRLSPNVGGAVLCVTLAGLVMWSLLGMPL